MVGVNYNVNNGYIELVFTDKSILDLLPQYMINKSRNGVILASDIDVENFNKYIDLRAKNKTFKVDGKVFTTQKLCNLVNILKLFLGFERKLEWSFAVDIQMVDDALYYIKEKDEEMYNLIKSEVIDNSILFEFQKVSIILYIYKMLSEERKRFLIGDERGLGKTIQSLYIVKLLKLYPTLIIVPAYLRLNWYEAIKSFNISNNLFIIRNSKDLKFINSSKKDIYIISYELFAKQITMQECIKKKFKSVILDEIQYIKNSQAKRTKNIVNLVRNIEYVIGLSGTPIWNKPHDGFQVFNVMDSNLFPYKIRFIDRYCKVETKKFKGRTVKVIVGSKNTDELAQRIRTTFMIRRTKKLALPQLPSKIRNKIYMDLDETIKSLSDEILDYIEGNSFTKGYDYLELEEKIRNFQQHVGLVKIPQTISLIKEILDNQESVVVFFYNRIVGFTLHNELQKEGIKSVLFIGGLDDKERIKRLKEFIEGDCDVFLGSIRACGLGLNLTKANNIIFIQYDTSPNWDLQAEDRCVRIGQNKITNIYYITMKDTIDEIMIDTLIRKSNYIDKILMDNNESKIEFERENIIKDLVKKLKENEEFK